MTDGVNKKLTSSQFDLFHRDFSTIDADHTKAIDINELGKLLERQLERIPTSRELRATMKQFDKNNDGLVSLHEYITAVCGNGWIVAGATLLNAELLFERYAVAPKQANVRGRGVRGSGSMTKNKKKGQAAPEGNSTETTTLESRSKMPLADMTRLATKCKLFPADNNAPAAIGTKVLTLPTLQTLWSASPAGQMPGGAMDLAEFLALLDSISEKIGASLDATVDHMRTHGSNPGGVHGSDFSRAKSTLLDAAENHYEKPEEAYVAPKPSAPVPGPPGAHEGLTRAQLAELNDDSEDRNPNKYGSAWNTDGVNDSGVGKGEVAVDGEDLFKRFAAHGTGTQFTLNEDDEDEGTSVRAATAKKNEIDSGGFTKFFRECMLLDDPTDEIPINLADVDIWWMKLKKNKDIPHDERGVMHLDYKSFRVHVLEPLADRKKMGSQLMVIQLISRLPHAKIESQ